jgi:hypothetical protein
MSSNVKCLNKSLPRVQELLKYIPKESVLAGIIEDLGNNATDYNIINYYNKDVKYQTPSSEGQIASEKTIRDLTAKISDRIGIPYRIESDRSKNYKGKIKNNIAYINLAYATLDTPIHEILGHPIIRAIKSRKNYYKVGDTAEFHGYGNPERVTITKIFDETLEVEFKNSEGNTYKADLFELDKAQNTLLYQNLLKELEYGKGKEVLDRIKRDYIHKPSFSSLPDVNKYGVSLNELIDILVSRGYTTENAVKEINKNYLRIDGENLYFNYPPHVPEFYGDYGPDISTTSEQIKKALNREDNQEYTLEEQQEEAIVELVGLMTADKLDAVKDGKLISLLKRLLKEMKQFIRSLINQKEVKIDELPDNMTINDLADLLAYSNSKLILPGYEVEYTTPDNMNFKTYQEASNHISQLAKNVKDVDLNNVELSGNQEVPENLKWEFENQGKTFKELIENKQWKISDDTGNTQIVANQEYNGEKGGLYWDGKNYYHLSNIDNKKTIIPFKEFVELFSKIKQFGANKDKLFQDRVVELSEYEQEKINPFKEFINKNKQYEQSKEIIEEWKKINNIVYNPEEIYSRGQEFSSVVGAYSEFDVDLMMQNLLHHIEDNEKAGGKFAISSYTKPIDKTINHLEGGGGKIKFKIYPKPEDILWASNVDVYSGSVWDASEKVNKDKKSELLGVSYTKYPSLNQITTIQPNLASIVDDLAHHHNELGITLTGNNFRLEYDDNIPYSTKKIIDSVNKILDQKYGKLIKSESTTPKLIKTEEFEKFSKETEEMLNNGIITLEQAAKRTDDFKGLKRVIKNIVIQPTQTKDNLKESIESVKSKVVKYNEGSLTPKEEFTEISEKEYNEAVQKGKQGFDLGTSSFGYSETYDYNGYIYTQIDYNKETGVNTYGKIKKESKEYTSQALINTKIAKIKEVAKKYPRSLISSKVVQTRIITDNPIYYELDDTMFQKLQDIPEKVESDVSQEIESAMESILARYGVTVERMKKVFHGKLSVIALADITNKVVKVSQGADKLTLPEETGHFILELLGENNSLLQRIVELARKTQVYADIYDDYIEFYKGDEYEVAKEAAAKILKRSLASAVENPLKEEQSIWNQIKKTIDLIMKRIKYMFKTLKDDELTNLLDKVAYGVVNNQSSITNQLSWDNVSNDLKNDSKGQLEVDRIRKIVDKLKSSLIQKLAIYRKRSNDTQDKVDYQLRINDALERLKNLESIEAIGEFIQFARVDLNLVQERLRKMLKNPSELTIANLEGLYQYTASYSVLEDISKIYTTDETLKQYQHFIRTDLLKIYNDVKDTYTHEGAKLLSEFYSQHVTKELGLSKEDIEFMLLESVGDVGKFTSFIQSVGETDSDVIVGLLGKTIRYIKQDVMMNTNAYKKRIADLITKYEKELGKNGDKLWDTIMQYDTKGKVTGRHIEKLGSKFWETRKALQEELKLAVTRPEKIEVMRKYIDFSQIADENLRLEILTYPDEGIVGQWHYQNKNNPEYFDKKFLNLTSKELQFLNDYITILNELRNQLPTFRNYRNLLPQVQSGLSDKLRNVKNNKERIQILREHLTLVEKTDGKNTTLFKQDGSEAKFIPIHYVGRLTNPETIERDLGASLLMFAEMAINNKLMHSIEDAMMMTLHVVGEREVTPTRFGKALKPVIDGTVTPTIKGFQTNTYNLLKEYIDMQVYGEVQKEELLGRFNIGKAANMINAFTAIKGLAGNLFSSVSSVTVGRFMRLMEGIAGEHFTISDWKYGNKKFFEDLIPSLSDLTERHPSTKFALFVEKLDLVQGFEDAIRASESKLSQTKFKRNMKLSHMFILNNLGEFMLQVSTSLAYGRNYVLENGNVVNFYESAYVDANGNLKFKNGITGKDIKNYIDRVKGINESLDGIYSKADKSIAQRYAVGRLAFLFRRFVVPTFSKRWKNFSGPKFNVKRNAMEEGFYISLFKFLAALTKEMKLANINMSHFKNEWNKTEKFRQANVKRAATELITLLALALITKLMEGEIDDDDEPALAFTFYQLNRMYVELGAFAPPIGVTEAFKLVKSPAAGVNTLQDLTRLTFDLFHPWDEFEGGKHEGDLKIYWHTIKMIPIVNQVEKLKGIDEQTKGIQVLF